MKMDDDGIGLGQSAEDFYNKWSAKRTGPVARARRLADITIPSIFPPENWESEDDDLEVTNQSVNAFAINSLSNELTLAALPPNLPMAKYTPIESRMGEDIKRDPELYSEVKYALSRREETHRSRLETTMARDVYGTALKSLLVTGNRLVLWTDIDKPRSYDMHSYVVVRDAAGVPLVTVLEDHVAYAVADDDVKEAAESNWAKTGKGTPSGSDHWSERIKVYHCQKLIANDDGEKEWVYWQEVEGGTVVPDTEAFSPFDVPAMMPAGMIHVTGSNWCLPYCLDYEGDLQAVENFASALQDGAAAMAWFLFFVNPTGHTNIKDVQGADNLDVLSGRADDVTSLQVNKAADLSVVSSEFANASRRLGFEFNLQTAIQRDAERVTQEEWQRMARALDRAMGGLYTALSQGLQRWFVLRFIHLHELEDEDLKPLPEGMVQLGVVTGLDSIGQSTEHSNLIDWAREGMEVLGPEAFQMAIIPQDFLRRSAANRGVKVEGLVKSMEQARQEEMENMNKQAGMALLDKAAGPLAKGGADMMAAMMQQQQPPQQGDTNG